jgi:hypothetical protein
MYTVNSSNVCYHQYPGPTPPFPARGFYLSLFSSFFSSSSPSFFSSTTLSSPFSYLPSLSSYYAYAFFFASSSIIFRASSSVTSSTTADDSPCFFLAASSYSFYYFFFFSSSDFFLMAYSLYLSSWYTLSFSLNGLLTVSKLSADVKKSVFLLMNENKLRKKLSMPWDYWTAVIKRPSNLSSLLIFIYLI